MPALPLVGGHTVRTPIQINPETSVNMFPELDKQLTELQPRARLRQISTHGYRQFLRDGSLPPVTGLAGTRQRFERLAVANGRTLRIFTDPDDASPTAALTHRIRPVFGAAQYANAYHWVREDGTVARRFGTGPVQDAMAIPGLRIVGLGLYRNTAGTITRFFTTVVEDRTVRAWQLTGANIHRLPQHDLDLGDTAVNTPESIWVDTFDSTVDGSPRRFVLITDGITGRILEYSYDPSSADAPWALSTPLFPSNPLLVQRLLGDDETREPVRIGGIWASADNISIVDRANTQIRTLDRHTGVLSGATQGLSGLSPQQVCGVVNGLPSLTFYINGDQGSSSRTGFFTTGGRVAGQPPMPDRVDPHPDPTPLVPLGDDGRSLAWLVDRRVVILDLVADKVIENVEGAVDSLAYGTGRLVGADASEGVLKFSPVNQIRTPAEVQPQDRYGQAYAAASISLPGWPRAAPSLITSIYPGIRSVLATTEEFRLWSYPRGEDAVDGVLEKPPTELFSGQGHVFLRVCAAGDETMTVQGLSDPNNVFLRLFTRPPTPATSIASARTSQTVRVGYDVRERLHSVASDGTNVFLVFSTSSTVPRQMFTASLATGAGVDGLNITSDHQAFADVDLRSVQDSPTSSFRVPYDWIRGITSKDGLLFVAFQHLVNTQVRTSIWAFEIDRSGRQPSWRRAAGRDVTDGASESDILAHDAQYFFEGESKFITSPLSDGTPVGFVTLNAWQGATADRLSKYSWDPVRSNRTGAQAVAVVRRTLYAWTGTGMELRDMSDATQLFPPLTATRTIGLAAPRSIVLVSDVLYWAGATDGGGLRLWSIGLRGDLNPQMIESKSISEMLARIAARADVSDLIGYGDDTSDHPTVVLHSRSGGISMAYDADADHWHCRSSLGGNTGLWPWLRDDQGAQRVTHSTTWQHRLVLGGYTAALRGVLAFADQNDWQDIDGGQVLRQRDFRGPQAERRRVLCPPMRIDCVYALETDDCPDPKFELWLNDQGGVERAWEFVDTRRMADEPPYPFNQLGTSRQRVYRIRSVENCPFVVHGAYIDPPTSVSKRV